MKLRGLSILLAVTLVFLMSSTYALSATSASIMYQETNLGGGLWQYDYTFNNLSDAGESLFKIFLSFNQSVIVTGSALPGGWVGTVWEGTNTTDYLDTMGLNSNYYIAANYSLSGFSFTANYQAGSIPFHAEFQNSQGGFSAVNGTTAPLAPPVVPEPISTVLFLTGGSLLVIRNRWKRRRV